MAQEPITNDRGDVIIDQEPGFIYYRAGELGPAVPYVSQRREESTNFGFADLRKQPELIPTIPEAQNNPGLMAMIAAANVPDGALMSIGCECVLWPEENQGFAMYIHSYLEVTFHDAAKNASEDRLLLLAKTLAKHTDYDTKHPIMFQLGLERMRKFFNDESPHFCLNVEISAFGNTEEEVGIAYQAASHAMANAIRLVGQMPWPLD